MAIVAGFGGQRASGADTPTIFTVDAHPFPKTKLTFPNVSVSCVRRTALAAPPLHFSPSLRAGAGARNRVRDRVTIYDRNIIYFYSRIASAPIPVPYGLKPVCAKLHHPPKKKQNPTHTPFHYRPPPIHRWIAFKMQNSVYILHPNAHSPPLVRARARVRVHFAVAKQREHQHTHTKNTDGAGAEGCGCCAPRQRHSPSRARMSDVLQCASTPKSITYKWRREKRERVQYGFGAPSESVAQSAAERHRGWFGK